MDPMGPPTFGLLPRRDQDSRLLHPAQRPVNIAAAATVNIEVDEGFD
jgi:hypothetical protein